MNTAAVNRYTNKLAQQRGWLPGSSLENKFALKLSRLGIRASHDLVQQHRVGKYRLDFADPDVLIGVEADGFFHRMPGKPERDAERDAWLLTQGWFVFRVSDDCEERELEERLLAVVLLIRSERLRQELPWRREPSHKTPKPSLLAIAAGYNPSPRETVR